MATINFPSNPIQGQIYEYGDYRYTFDGVKWTSVAKYSASAVKLQGVTPPPSPEAGLQWFDDVSGRNYFWHINSVDGEGQWVEEAPQGVIDPIEEDLLTEYSMTEAEFTAMRQASLASGSGASGFESMGKHTTNPVNIVNQGLSASSTSSNSIFLGRSNESSLGISKSEFPIINLSGVRTEFGAYLNSTNKYDSNAVKFPEAPTGAQTYDSATSEYLDFEVDVDPKYGDVAGDRNEAVIRAWEGVIDSRDLFTSIAVNLGGGEYLIDATTGSSPYVRLLDTPEASSFPYVVEFTVQPGEGEVYLNVGAGAVTFGGFASGSHRVVVTSTSNNGQLPSVISINKMNSSTNLVVSDISLRPATNEVVTDRVDMWGFEGYLEEVTVATPQVSPKGLIQAQDAEYSGVATTAGSRAVTYYSVYDGDTESVGTEWDWNTLEPEDKRKILADKSNNLYVLIKDDGSRMLCQWKIRQRTIAGAGNGDWLNVNPEGVLKYAVANTFVTPQGDLDTVVRFSDSSDGFYNIGADYVKPREPGAFIANNVSGTGDFVNSVNGECHFLVCGTVSRLNQGAYHPSFNPIGSARFLDTRGFVNTGHLWYTGNAYKPSALLECFTKVSRSPSGSIISTATGRPDNRFYDAIYASGQGGVLRDMRYPTDAVTPTYEAEQDLRVKNGEYRGFEKRIVTNVFYAGDIIKTSTVTNEYPSSGVTHRFTATGTVRENIGGDVAISSVGAYYYLLGDNGNSMVLRCDRFKGGPSIHWKHTNGNVYLYVCAEDYSTALDSAFPNGTTIQAWLLTENELPTSTGGSFLQTDVTGNPANILLTDALKDGWHGSWIPVIPDGTESFFPATRKSLSSALLTVVITSDNGVTWGTSGVIIDSITNKSGWAAPSATTIGLIPYTAYAKVTEPADNAVVKGGAEGIGEVSVTASSASTLTESLLGIVNTSVRVPGTISPMFNTVVERASIYDKEITSNLPYWGKLVVSTSYPIMHSVLEMPPLESGQGGCKYLNYSVDLNQQAVPHYAATELVWDTDWGDDSKITIVDQESTKTDLNGNTVKVVTHKLKEPIGWYKNPL